MAGRPERFTPLNRVPFGKFNRVNSEPVNAYSPSLCQALRPSSFCRMTEKILVIHPGALGDLVLSFPVLVWLFCVQATPGKSHMS